MHIMSPFFLSSRVKWYKNLFSYYSYSYRRVTSLTRDRCVRTYKYVVRRVIFYFVLIIIAQCFHSDVKTTRARQFRGRLYTKVE